MIDYGDWCISPIPGTGAQWLMEAARLAGYNKFTLATNELYWAAPAENYRGLTVSMVRHPVQWNLRLYQQLPEGHALFGKGFSHYVRETYLKYGPDMLWRAVQASRAKTLMRWEDMPWAAVQFFDSLGVAADKLNAVKQLTLDAPHRADPLVAQFILQCEPALCEHFDYW